MLGDGLSVALAGLLHDVGKLYSRARWGERDDQVPVARSPLRPHPRAVNLNLDGLDARVAHEGAAAVQQSLAHDAL